MARPLKRDPVEAAHQHWIEHGWESAAPGMAVVVSVMRAGQIFVSHADDILRPLGLTFARYQVLGIVRWSGPETLGGISEQLWIAPSTVTNAVNRLEAAGLIRRVTHPEDARATLAEITPKGRRTMDRAVLEINVKLFSAVTLSEKEMLQLIGLIRKIRAGEGDF
jgi:DNA-binding MarR family transcriptional regulator